MFFAAHFSRGFHDERGDLMKSMKKEVLFSKEVISGRIRSLADEISRDYAGGELIVIGVLKGAFIFMADLIRSLKIPCMVDFAQLASYGSGSVSSGNVAIKKDIGLPIAGKDVLIVEDIVDTGLTLSFLVKTLKERSPRSLKVCVFLDKKTRRKVPFTADYTGFTIDDGFVVGYGLDFNEQARFLPDVYVIKE
jgi:hypoxanthine phosphoribosyltransferase